LWNGLNKQGMYVSMQEPDEQSKMTKQFLYITIERVNEPIIRRPRTPSMLDLFSDMWIEA